MSIFESDNTIPDLPSWDITPKKVQTAIDTIVTLFNPSKLIVFGSYIKGTMHRNSDLDLLVVTENDVENPRRESIRIRRSLKGIQMPMDILVVGKARLRELADAPGLIYREALRTGRVVYER